MNDKLKQTKKPKKYQGITHILESKGMTSRGLWTRMQEMGFSEHKTYDLCWWVTSGSRLPSDTRFFTLAAEILKEPIQNILDCYQKR